MQCCDLLFIIGTAQKYIVQVLNSPSAPLVFVDFCNLFIREGPEVQDKFLTSLGETILPDQWCETELS